MKGQPEDKVPLLDGGNVVVEVRAESGQREQVTHFNSPCGVPLSYKHIL